MLTIGSKITKINQPGTKVYNFLSDFNNLKKAFAEKAESWESTTDSCKFKANNYPSIGLKISERIPYSLIKYTDDGIGMFNFSLDVHLENIQQNETNIQIIINADIGAAMKVMAEKPLQIFADGMVDFLSTFHYNY